MNDGPSKDSYLSLLNEYSGELSPVVSRQELVEFVNELPAMPNVAAKALKMIDDPDSSVDQLVRVISADTAFTSRILKLANSAAFALQRQVTNLDHAITVIGLRTLRASVVVAALRQISRPLDATRKMIWEHSLATACAASILAGRLERRDGSDLYLLGMLKSLGQIAMLSHEKVACQYELVLDKIRDEHVDYPAAEREVIGFSHPLIGALVANKWSFPSETANVILHYCDPTDELAESSNDSTLLIKTAAQLSFLAGIGCPPGYPVDREQVLSLLRLTRIAADDVDADPGPILDELLSEVKTAFVGESQVYS